MMELRRTLLILRTCDGILLSFLKLYVIFSPSLHRYAQLSSARLQPELLSGSVRENLDPFDEHDDATLNRALRSAGLFSLQEDIEGDENRITLDSAVASGGGNMSVGQKQLIQIARAIVRQSKLLILDEATSAIGELTLSTIVNL